MTKDEAVAELVRQDVAKWGEAEREASHRFHSQTTHGLALNALYARASLAGDRAEVKRYRALCKDALTPEDLRVLRQGG